MSLYNDAGEYHGTATHVYNHPEGKGFGEHHVEDGHPSLDQRSAAWQGVDGLNVEPHPAETHMGDLDMPSGTEVQLLEDMDSGDKRVLWEDQMGTVRITAINPDFFSEHFQEVGK